MQPRDPIIEKIKAAARSAESRPFPGMDNVWNRVEERLDEERAQQPAIPPFPGMEKVWNTIEKKLEDIPAQQRKTIPFRRISIAAAALLLLGLGMMYMIAGKDKVQDGPAYVQETKVHPVDQAGTGSTRDLTGIQDRLNSIAPDQPGIVPPSDKLPRRHYRKATVHHSTPGILYTQAGIADDGHASYLSRMIRGKVTDINGEGIPGAMVIAQGMRSGTMTDVDGNYEIRVDGSLNALEIKALGMLPETVTIDQNDRRRFTVMASDPAVMAEISVYGNTADKRTYIGSVQTITGSDLASRPATDIDKALAGALPGVRIKRIGGRSENGSDLLLRGVNSGNNASPLVVIDGTFYSGSSVALKSGEVESLTVLKDETATAAYGAKGSNGVIVIKTRNGKGYEVSKDSTQSGFMQKIKGIFSKKNKTTK